MEEKIIKNYCTECRQETNHSTLYSITETSEKSEDFYWSTEYSIVQCKGCSNICFRSEYEDQSMFEHDESGNHQNSEIINYPRNLKEHKINSNVYYLPKNIKTIYLETIEAFKSRCYLLAGVGFRGVIEAICLEENIKGNNLEQKIKNLSKNKLITEREEKRLHSIRFLGNDSVHEMVVPSKKKLFIVLEIVEHVLNNLYLIDKNAASELDSIIDDYEKFKELLWFKVMNLVKGDEKNLKEIFTKDIRRVYDNIEAFEKRLIEEIKKKNIEYLELGKTVSEKNDTSKVQYYIVTSSKYLNNLPFDDFDF